MQAIADARGMDHDRVRELINTGPRTAAEAQDVGLVDRLGYRDQVYDEMRARTGGEPDCCSLIGGGPAASLPHRLTAAVTLPSSMSEVRS